MQYSNFGLLSENIRALYQIFPETQVKIILFDDFVSDTKRIYDDVLNFLSLPHHEISTFAKVNEARSFRGEIVGKLIRTAPLWMHDLMLKFRMNPALRFIPILINKWVKKTQKRKALSPAFRDSLKLFFNNDVEQLSEILGKDLSSWKM